MAKVRNLSCLKICSTRKSAACLKIKMQPEMSEQMKINHFHSLLRTNALQTFRNISTANRQTLEDVFNHIPTKIRQTRVSSNCQTQMAPYGIWSKHNKTTRLLRRTQPRRRKGVWGQRPKDDWQPPIRKTAAETENISQYGLTGEWLLWWNCRSSWERVGVKRTWGIWWPSNSVNDIFNHENKNCSFQGADEWHYLQLLQRKVPYGQRLQETQEEKLERCPTRQTDPEKDLPQMQHLWQDQPPRREICWQGAGAHLKSKRTRPEDSSDNDPDSKAPKPH